MKNELFYEEVYEKLYKNGYIVNDTDSHIFEDRYPTAGLLHTLNESGISYESVLDVGCGRGNGLAIFKKLDKNVAGVEISQTAVNAATSKGLKVKKGSATSIPYGDAEFDLVVSTDVIEHLYEEDVRKALSEIVRCSKRYIGLKIAPGLERGSVNLVSQMKSQGSLPQDLENLHLTTKSPEFWRNLLETEFNLKMIKEQIDIHPSPEIGIHGYRVVLEKPEK